MDRVELSGFILLSIGIILLLFTFFNAYIFLVGGISTLGTGQISAQTFEPLIEAMVRMLYLVVMGWIGSIVTNRGIQLIRKQREVAPLPQPSVKEDEKENLKETKPEESQPK